MANPTLKVELAFVSDPLDTAPTYVDITAYVRQKDGVNITRGGTGDPDSPDQAGRCTLTLSSLDRRFDWTYTAGPYYGYLTPKRQIRISGTVAGVDYPIFKGWVTGFPSVAQEMGKDYVCKIEAYDAIGYLAGVQLPTSTNAYGNLYATLSVFLTDPSPTGWADTGVYGTYSAVAALTATSALVPESSMVPGRTTGSATANGIGWYTLPTYTNVDGWSISFWIKSSTVGTSYTGNVAPILSGPNGGIVGINASGKLYLAGTSTGAWSITSSIAVNDGRLHHVFVQSFSSVAPTVYIDGQLDAAATVPSASTWSQNYSRIFATQSAAPTSAEILTATSIQDIAIGSSGASAAQVLAMYNGWRGWVVESSATRAGRMLDAASWPAGWRDISTATRAECGPISFTGQAVLTGLQEVERSEQGRVYATMAGKLALRQRYYAYEDTVSNTVQLTFSDDGADEHYRTFGHHRGDLDICNDVTVSNGITESRSTDATSATSYGATANSYTTVLSSYSQVKDMAAGIVFLRKDARIRLDPINVRNTANSWAALLQLELASRIQVEATPMGVGTQMQQQVLAESISWDISDQGWGYTVSGMPIPPDPITVGFWTLDVSQLDAGTALAY